MPNELGWATVCCGNNRLSRAPRFKQHDAKWLVSAGNANNVASLIKTCQGSVVLKTQKTCGMSDTQLTSPIFGSSTHLPIACKQEFRIRIELQNMRNCFDQQVRALLNHHTAGEKHCRIHGSDGVVVCDHSTLDNPVIVPVMGAVVDGGCIPVRD